MLVMDEAQPDDLELAEPLALPDSDEGMEALTFNIRHDLQKRLDIYLRDRLSTHSRSMLQKLIKSGTVLVNGRAASANRGGC